MIHPSDTARANWSSLLSALIGVGAALLLAQAHGGIATREALPFTIDV